MRVLWLFLLVLAGMPFCGRCSLEYDAALGNVGGPALEPAMVTLNENGRAFSFSINPFHAPAGLTAIQNSPVSVPILSSSFPAGEPTQLPEAFSMLPPKTAAWNQAGPIGWEDRGNFNYDQIGNSSWHASINPAIFSDNAFGNLALPFTEAAVCFGLVLALIRLIWGKPAMPYFPVLARAKIGDCHRPDDR
jgi:hypothetical protein